MNQVLGRQLGAAIRQAVPPELVPLFAVVTFFGGVGFLLVVFTVDYWFVDQRRGAHAFGLAVCGAALVVALKAFFGVPRPPDELTVIPVSGYSFPSGHATMSAVAYGVLAYDLRKSTFRVRAALAGVVVVLVSLSRVVLGVHYVRDVVAGVAVGALFLLVALAVTRRVPRLAFWLAAGVGAVALAVSGASQDGLAVFGAATGAVVAWEVLRRSFAVDPSVVESTPGRAVLAVGVLPLLAVVGYAMTRMHPPSWAVVALGGVLTTTILAAPLAVERADFD